MDLKPSQIFYSQDSINNFFDKRTSHNRTRIGETLDAICEGRCQISSIPTITVVKRNGKWVTSDNRRLWVFRELERLGKCDTIPVRISSYIPDAKLTSFNGGTSVRVRRLAGGYWHNKPTPHKPPVQSTMQISNKASTYQSGYKVKDLSESPTIVSYKAPTVYTAPTPTPLYNIHINDTPSSIPIHMTTAPKTKVAITVETSPEHTPRLKIRSTSDSSPTNQTSSGLHSTYKAPVHITPISYSSSKYPSFSDIGKANEDNSRRHTHSQHRDQSSYSKKGSLSEAQERDQHSSYPKQCASSVSQDRNKLSTYTIQGSPSRSTVSRSDYSVDHASVRATVPKSYASDSQYDMPTYREDNTLNYRDSNKTCCGCTIL